MKRLFQRKFCLALTFLFVFNTALRGQDSNQEISDSIPGLFESHTSLQDSGSLHNYHQIMKVTDQYFQKYPAMKEKQEETYKNYQRWKYFWQYRMGKIGKSKTGSQYANQIMSKRLESATAQNKMPTSV